MQLQEWASGLSSPTQIAFQFEYCKCCATLIEEDWEHLRKEDERF